MYPFLTVNVRSFERAFLFREGELLRLLSPGRYRLWNPKRNLRVDLHGGRWFRVLQPRIDRSASLPSPAPPATLTPRHHMRSPSRESLRPSAKVSLRQMGHSRASPTFGLIEDNVLPAAAA
jgi:hypothetical protein